VIRDLVRRAPSPAAGSLAISLALLGACDAEERSPGDRDSGGAFLDAGGDSVADADTTPRPDAAAACSGTALRIIPVATAAELESSLAGAEPGDRIELADRVYQGSFATTRSGTGENPIALCGSRGAVLQGESVQADYGLHLQADWWVLVGFTVTLSQKGVMLDGASHNVLSGLEVFAIGDEAIHLRSFSSDNAVESCTVHDTGKRTASFGEGIYLGSAESNWDTYSGGAPDRSDRNQVLDNVLGPNITTEAIDIKEGTEGGLVRGNTFDGRGMTGDNFGDSWVDVKGNGYVIEDNQGDTALADGFQTHVVVDGWGNGTVFRGNAASGVPGYCINVDADSVDTVVACDNQVTGPALGLSNVDCE
jgi:hypothetical protein